MTDNMILEKKLYDLAVNFIKRRYPEGWGGAAVIRTADDRYLTSVSIDTANEGASLCIETGAICEAHKFDLMVTHCICVVRDDENSPFKILSPCGICQERLRFWGKDVQVGVTTVDNSIKFASLGELQPYHWTDAYPSEELEHYQEG